MLIPACSERADAKGRGALAAFSLPATTPPRTKIAASLLCSRREQAIESSDSPSEQGLLRRGRAVDGGQRVLFSVRPRTKKNIGRVSSPSPSPSKPSQMARAPAADRPFPFTPFNPSHPREEQTLRCAAPTPATCSPPVFVLALLLLHPPPASSPHDL